MIWYVIVLFLYTICMGFAYLDLRKYLYTILLLGVLPLLLLVLLRGNVGTDTAAYIRIVSDVKANQTGIGIEEGFVYLIKALLHITNDPMFVLILIALLTTVVIFIASKYDDRALFVLLVCIMPLFYLDMTMNGLRYGLSFAFAMLAISKFYQHHLFFSVALGVIAVLFHVSGLLVFLIMALLADNKIEFIRWLKLMTILLLVVLAQYYLVDIINYFLKGKTPYFFATKGAEVNLPLELDAKGKYIAYKSFTSPSWYSGLAPLIISWLFIYVLHASKKQAAFLANYQFHILISLTSVTFILAKFSYAGLRLQLVVLFTILLMMQFKPKLAGIMDVTIKKRMFVIGCIGVIVFVKNLILTQGQGPSPFAPWLINPNIVQFWNVING